MSKRAASPDADTAGDVAGDPDVCSVPLEGEDGEEIVICQQNVGRDNEVGQGEFPDPNSPPKDPAEAAREQRSLDAR